MVRRIDGKVDRRIEGQMVRGIGVLRDRWIEG